MRTIEDAIGLAATKIANDIDANCIVSVTGMNNKKEGIEEDHLHLDVQVAIFKQVKKGVYSKIDYQTSISKVSYGSIVPIKEILMEGISKNYIKKGDKVVCAADASIGSGYKGLLFVFDVDRVFFNISTHNLAEKTSPDVIETLVNIALEISKEGREGRRVGTAFVIGDKQEILKYIKQLIINPFAGYPESVRKITNPALKETIKEFSQLDGVFVVDNSGMVVTSGAYIDIPTLDLEMPQGLGTRHRSCAAITKETGSIAIVVSQSGSVRVLKSGKIVLKLQ